MIKIAVCAIVFLALGINYLKNDLNLSMDDLNNAFIGVAEDPDSKKYLDPDENPIKETESGEDEKPNKYLINDCFSFREDKWEFFKIKSIKSEKEVYLFESCRKYQGCSPDLLEASFKEFERKFSLKTKYKCK